MKCIVAAVLSIAAIIGQSNTASAQQYSSYYYYGAPCCAPTPINLGWAYTRNQPPGDAKPYPALQMADGTLACSHSNYRPNHSGWCQRIW